MDQKILEQLQDLQKALTSITNNMVTKQDAKSFATKDDLKSFATKDDLNDALINFVTKDDLKATKNELLEKLDKLDKMQVAIIKATDWAKEDKIVVQNLKNRIERLEETVFT